MSDEITSGNAEAPGTASVQQMLEMAIQNASDQGMSTSELLGIFYYYTHSIAESYREDALKKAEKLAAQAK